MAICAAGRPDIHQIRMVRCRGVGCLPAAGMALRTIAGRLNRRIGGDVVAVGTAIVLLVIRRIDEVGVVDGLCVTTATTRLHGHQATMVLGDVRTEITGHASMTLAAVTRGRTGQLGGVVMTDVAGVVLQIISQVDKTNIIDRVAVTAGTAGGLGDLGRMVFGVGGPIASDAAVTGTAVNRSGADDAVGGMTTGAGIMFLIIKQIDEALTCRQCRRMTAGTFAV